MYTTYEGKRVFYDVQGNGAAVLLLHGYMEDHSIWQSFRSLLQLQYRVITPDLPGHGQTGVMAAAHSITLQAECMLKVLAQEGVRECMVCGHSLGGYIALEMAALEPGKIKSIMLLHSTARADSAIKKAERDRVVKVLETNPGLFVREAIPGLFAPGSRSRYANEINALIASALEHSADGLIATTRGMRDREDKTHWLQNTKHPVHFIIGRQDTVIPFETYNAQVNAGDHISHYISEHSGHMGFIEDAENVYNSIRNFFAGHYPAT